MSFAPLIVFFGFIKIIISYTYRDVLTPVLHQLNAHYYYYYNNIFKSVLKIKIISRTCSHPATGNQPYLYQPRHRHIPPLKSAELVSFRVYY